MPEMIRFRTSFSGFNRVDVANYIETSSKKHQEELAALRGEAVRLQKEKDELLAQVEELSAHLAAAENGETPETVADPETQELLAYRRAEAAERSANQRIRRQMEKLTELMAAADTAYGASAEELQATMAELRQGMEKMESLFKDVEVTFAKTEAAMDELKNEV